MSSDPAVASSGGAHHVNLDEQISQLMQCKPLSEQEALMADLKKMNACQCHLPDELIFLILLKLPVKSLCRFSCVSKTWQNMISSSGAASVKSMYDQSQWHRQPYLLIENCIQSLHDREVNYKAYQKLTSSVSFTVLDKVAGKVHDKFELQIPQSDINSVQSCHGLLCIFGKPDIGNYIGNPSTREFKKVPNLPFGRRVVIAGLGYLPSKNEYKIVAWHRKQHLGGRCSILTITKDGLKGKSGGSCRGCGWRGIRNARPSSRLFSTLDKCRQPLCINGVLYFWDKITRNQIQEVIVSFDLETEEAGIIPCPPFSFTRNFRMLEMKGRLCCADFFFEEFELMIWERIDDAWENTFSLDVSKIRPCPVQLLAHVSADGKDEELILKTDEQGLVYYNLKSRSYRVPEHLAHIRITGSDFAVLVCFDSFFTLKGFWIQNFF